MTPSTPRNAAVGTFSPIELASMVQLRGWFDRTLIIDYRQLEKTRRSTLKTIIVATAILAILFGTILTIGVKLLPTTTPVERKVTSQITDSSEICPPGIAKSECDLLKNNPQIGSYLTQLKTEPKSEVSYSLIEFYQIPVAIFAAIIGLSWIFITFIGGVIDNYRVGWRSPIVRKLIDFIDLDRTITYIGQADPTDLREALLHSGMATRESAELMYINSDDAIAIKRQNIRISWSDLHGTIPTQSLLSIVESLSRIIHERSGINRFFKINFVSLIIKALRAIIYLIKSSTAREFDLDNFTREIIGNEGGRKTIFKGIFAQIMLPETDERGQTILIPKQRNQQSLRLKIPPHLRPVIDINEPEFEQLFTIYSSNRQIHSQIISPIIKQLAMDYYRSSKYPIYLSVNDRMVYISILSSTKFMEPKLGQNMLNFAPIRDYYLSVKFILDIAGNIS